MFGLNVLVLLMTIDCIDSILTDYYDPCYDAETLMTFDAPPMP
jgi:hypothetical protein